MSSSNSAVTTPKPPPPTLVTTNTPSSLSVSSTGTVSPSSLNTTPGLMKEKTKPINEEDNEDDQKKRLFSALIQYEKGNQDIIGIMVRFYPLLVKDYEEYIMNYQYEDEADFKSKFETIVQVNQWSQSELNYLQKMIDDFKSGTIDDMSNGTILLDYLAEQLGCEPERIRNRKYHSHKKTVKCTVLITVDLDSKYSRVNQEEVTTVIRKKEERENLRKTWEEALNFEHFYFKSKGKTYRRKKTYQNIKKDFEKIENIKKNFVTVYI